MLALVPPEAAKETQVRRHFLFGVVAKAVFECAEMLVQQNIRLGIGAVEIGVDRFAIGAHVRAVGVEEQAGVVPLRFGTRVLRNSNSPFCACARLRAQSRSMPLATVGMAKRP